MSVIGVTPSSQSYIGKIAGTLRAGDQEVKARGDLETAIQRFNASLSHFGHGVTFQMYDQVEGTPHLAITNKASVAISIS